MAGVALYCTSLILGYIIMFEQFHKTTHPFPLLGWEGTGIYVAERERRNRAKVCRRLARMVRILTNKGQDGGFEIQLIVYKI